MTHNCQHRDLRGVYEAPARLSLGGPAPVLRSLECRDCGIQFAPEYILARQSALLAEAAAARAVVEAARKLMDIDLYGEPTAERAGSIAAVHRTLAAYDAAQKTGGIP